MYSSEILPLQERYKVACSDTPTNTTTTTTTTEKNTAKTIAATITMMIK